MALQQALTVTTRQIVTQEEMVTNYSTLLQAENEKFRIGESSIFLLNSREQKLIEAQLKQLKLQAQYQKMQWKLRWAMGLLQ